MGFHVDGEAVQGDIDRALHPGACAAWVELKVRGVAAILCAMNLKRFRVKPAPAGRWITFPPILPEDSGTRRRDRSFWNGACAT